MDNMGKQVVFLIYAVVLFAFFYYLSPILTPFLLGILFAYLMRPVVSFMDRRRVPHLLSVTSVFLALVALVFTGLALLYPLIQQQFQLLEQLVPVIVMWFSTRVLPRLHAIFDLASLQASLTTSLPRVGQVFSRVIASGYTVIEWGMTVVLTPVIMFYFLRDWDRITSQLKNFIPRDIKPSVILLAERFDDILSAFFRGQLIIMVCLSLIYGMGLALTGLKVGVIIGLIAGLLSLVPYLGSLFVLIAGGIASYVEFGTWSHVLAVLGVYLVGQAVEGYVLTPILIGKRIGLHPVAVIFAVMAGGSLFGFFGILLSLPVAAFLAAILRMIA